LAATVVSAVAADLPAPVRGPAPAAVYVPLNDWTGFYVGISGGGGFGETTFVQTPTPVGTHDQSLRHDGGIVGGQVGFNYQWPYRFVLGAVADWSWAGIKGSVCVESGVCDGSSDDSFAKTKVSWLATFRGNLGFAPTNDLLAYVTGGFAVAGIEGRITHLTSGIDPDVTAKATRTGFAAGGGVKYKIARSWSLGAEYIYVHFGKHDYTFTNPAVPVTVTAEAVTHLNIIRGSLSYEFGNSNPIVARY
jgi:outer membrane immunogenic protein